MTYKKLSDISIQVQPMGIENGNFQSVLTEIKGAIEQLLRHKKVHTIDLKSMPWSPGEAEKLQEYLGTGEIKIEMKALGKSTIYETQYSGVWMINHYNEEDEVIAQLIEITYLPELIYSQTEDIRDSLEQFNNSLELN